MVIAVVILLVVISSLLLYFFNPLWFTSIASDWTASEQVANTSWLTGVVFVVVNLLLAYVVYRFRYHKNRKADYDPKNSKLEGWLTVLTSIGIIAMLAPELFF